ncbi:MAG: alcohol dehydrogenase, partial [Nostoc sp.]
MKAVLMIAAGSPEVLQVQEVPNPVVPVGNTELLIRLVA